MTKGQGVEQPVVYGQKKRIQHFVMAIRCIIIQRKEAAALRCCVAKKENLDITTEWYKERAERAGVGVKEHLPTCRSVNK